MQDVPRQATATETTERNGGRASRRDEILRIAMGLFARNGFDGTSIRDIADAAGLATPPPVVVLLEWGGVSRSTFKHLDV